MYFEVYVGKERVRDIVEVDGRIIKDIAQQTGAKLSIQDATSELIETLCDIG